MKLLVVVMLLVSSVCFASKRDDLAEDLGYPGAASIQVAICAWVQEFNQFAPQCQLFVNQLKSGHLVDERDYEVYCGTAAEKKRGLTKTENDYKKVFGKFFNTRGC